MEYFVVGICIVAVVVIVALLIYGKKKMSSPEGENKSDLESGAIIAKQTSELSQSDQKLDELVIQMEMLPAEAISDESKLPVKRLGIDTDEIRHKRAGFDGVIHFIPGLFNDDLNFRAIDEKIVKMIAVQASVKSIEHPQDTSDLYAEDVQLISKDGKIYYLPMDKAE